MLFSFASRSSLRHRSAHRFVIALSAFFLGYLFVAVPAADAAMKPVSTWVLGGIKLGMTPDQVARALERRGFSTVDRPIMMFCASEQAKIKLNGATANQPQSCVSRIDARSAKEKYTVYFYEDFPRHTGVTHVYDIVYAPQSAPGSGNFTEADARAYLDELTKRFGAPSAHIGGGVQWCPAGAAYPMGPCPGVSAQFNMAAVSIELSDTDLNSRSVAAINKYVESLRHTVNKI